ncbi:MAG: hypothetical protein ACP5MZ_02335 [Candidatus Micrarchaeia archaeon]
MYFRIGDMVNSLRAVFSEKRNVIIFAITTSLMFVLYAYLLSYSSIALIPGFIIFGLSVAVIIVSFLLSTLFSIVIVMNIYGIRQGVNTSTKLSIGSFLAAVLPSSVCCTALVPSLLALSGVSISTVIGTTGVIQGPIATYEPLLLLLSGILLLIAIYKSSIKLCSCKAK